MVEKTDYRGIYGSKSEPINEICMEPISKISMLYNWKIRQHIHSSLYQFFIIKEGTGFICQGEQKYTFAGPCFFIVPKNVDHGFEFSSGTRGRVITIPDYFLESMLQEDDYNVFELFGNIQLWSLALDRDIDKAIYNLLHECDWEYKGNLPGKKLLIRTYIVQLFVLIGRLPIGNISGAQVKDKSARKIFRQFVQLIRKEDAPVRKSIGEYAYMLNITAGHLNRICKMIAGKSSKDVVSDFVLSQAKNLLKESVHSISEIAYQLHFESPAYFTRFFKSKVGQSPREYRHSLSG